MSLLAGALLLTGCPQKMNQISIACPDSVSIGEQFQVDIIVSPSEKVSGVQCDLLYDPDIVEVVSVRQGNLFGADSFFRAGDREGDRINDIALWSYGTDSGADKEGVVATITFEATYQSGISIFKLVEVIIASPQAKPLPYEKFEKKVINDC